MNTRYQPKEWQRNPENVKTEKVQLWTNGIMVTAMMSNKVARQMVENGSAFIISDQAIGSMKNGYAYS